MADYFWKSLTRTLSRKCILLSRLYWHVDNIRREKPQCLLLQLQAPREYGAFMLSA